MAVGSEIGELRTVTVKWSLNLDPFDRMYGSYVLSKILCDTKGQLSCVMLEIALASYLQSIYS